MESLKKYWPQIIATIGVISPPVAWVANKVIEGAETSGYIKAKEEINETYNEALRDAIVYRAKFESCCSESED